jgi:hypothetical protein
MSFPSLDLYYFMIGDFNSQKEIGSITDNSKDNYSINDYNSVISNSKELFTKSSEEKIKNKKNLFTTKNFKIYFTLKNNGTFYLACIRNDESSDKELNKKKEKLIFDLIEDIDNQNIKKLVNKNGELTNVGKQNLKFTIEKKEKELNEEKEDFSSDILHRSNSDSSINKISFLNTQLNDIKQDVKLSVKNMINNVSEMQEIDSKSAQIKDTSYKFQQDAANLEGKLKCRKYLMKSIFYGLLSLPVLYILYRIFK